MDVEVLNAYNRLVPTDQLVIDAMIAALTSKDRQIANMVKEIHRRLDEDDEED